MDIGTLNILPATTGNNATSAPVGAGNSAPPTDVKPVVVVQKKQNNFDGNNAGAGTQSTANTGQNTPLTNVYVVSDQKFTIFKDPVGYVTKYTSLIDGHVTYIPDQNVARFLEAQRKAHPELKVNIDA